MIKNCEKNAEVLCVTLLLVLQCNFLQGRTGIKQRYGLTIKVILHALHVYKVSLDNLQGFVKQILIL